MGKFTALDDPMVDQTIECHLERIRAAVAFRMLPQAIILRGSFGRGEGSVMVQNGQLRFLSDYEIDVATTSPLYRSLFRELSRQLTAEFGVETSLRWVRPDYLRKGRVGPLPMGPAPTTISLYESRYGSQTIYGRDLCRSAPLIDPCRISLYSGIQLILNRMAESLYYVPGASGATRDEILVFHWVNKTILACAESLLLLWGQYHYSYEERGRRFAAAASDRLGFLHDQGAVLSELVARATEFKLRPRRALYQEPVREAWQQVIPMCDTVFRHLAEQVLGFSFSCYVEFPGLFLQYATDRSKVSSPLRFGAVKLLDTYKYLRIRRLPRGLLLPFDASRVVYAVVPLIFVGWTRSGESRSALLSQARHHLGRVSRLESRAFESADEWDTLRHHTLSAWKNFCYL